MRIHVYTRVLALAVVAAAGVSGCSTSHTTAFGSEATFNKVTGNMNTTVEANLDRSYAAAQGAVEDMQFTTESKAKDVTKAVVVARTADKTRVQITMEPRSENVTDVTVGVPAMGDESLAQKVLDKMVARLKAGKGEGK
jgi:hypothetical protein